MLGSWLEPLGVHPLVELQHVILGHTGPTKEMEGQGDAKVIRSRAKLRIRGVVSQRTIARGQTIAVVPRRSCLDGSRAAELLSSSTSLIDATSAIVRSAKPSVALPLVTRGPMLMTVALAVTRLRGKAQPSTRLLPFGPWISELPRTAPPIGCLLRDYTAAKTEEPEHAVTRRLRLGSQAVPIPSLPLLSASVVQQQEKSLISTSSSSLSLLSATEKEMMLANWKTSGGGAVVAARPSVEVALTPSMKACFQRGDSIALSSGHQMMHRSDRAEDESAFRHLAELETALVTNVLEPLVPCVLAALRDDGSLPASSLHRRQGGQEGTEIDDDVRLSDVGAGGVACGPREVLEALRWAHFCVRSRSVNLNHHVRSVSDGTPLPAIVPLVDMLNHCALNSNVVFQTIVGNTSPSFQDSSRVAIVASRAIPAGGELLMNYNDYWRRLVLYDTALAEASQPSQQQRIHAEMKAMHTEIRYERTSTHSSAAAPDGVSGDTFRRAALTTRETKRIDEKAKALVPSGPAHRRLVSAEVADAPRARDPQSRIGKRREGVSAAEWAWMFGFVKPAEEAAKEAGDRWHRRLFNAAAKLTAPLSKAEKGQFVIGVPAGLDRLKSQRDELVRGKYKGQQVFPPQRTH
jgi:hypothetical protein